MPRTKAVRKEKPPEIAEKKLDQNGKIKNWCCYWDEAIELEQLIKGPTLDGLTPASIRAKFPQYDRFAHAPFAGAVRNIRIKYNKETKARADHEAAGGKSKLRILDLKLALI